MNSIYFYEIMLWCFLNQILMLIINFLFIIQIYLIYIKLKIYLNIMTLLIYLINYSFQYLILFIIEIILESIFKIKKYHIYRYHLLIVNINFNSLIYISFLVILLFWKNLLFLILNHYISKLMDFDALFYLFKFL